jgi:hypothetical protein
LAKLKHIKAALTANCHNTSDGTSKPVHSGLVLLEMNTINLTKQGKHRDSGTHEEDDRTPNKVESVIVAPNYDKDGYSKDKDLYYR